MKFQGLDPACGVWMYCRKLRDGEENNKFLVRWEGYNVETWLKACELRNAITKRPLKKQPKKSDWPTVKHPSRLQRYDGIKVTRPDGTTSERKIVYVNDPYNGNVITACKQTLRYEFLSEWSETQVNVTALPNDELDTTTGIEGSDPQSPRSPSPPPPWTPEEHEELTASTSTKRRKVDKNKTSTPRTTNTNQTSKRKSTSTVSVAKKSTPRTTNTNQTSKRKSTSTVSVAKKAAKVLSTRGPKAVQSVDPQFNPATCSVPNSLLQKSKELLKQKKDEATTSKKTTSRVSVQPPSVRNTMTTACDEGSGARGVTVTPQANAEENRETENENIRAELRKVRAMFETLRQDVQKIKSAVATLTEDVSAIQTSHHSVSLGDTSDIFAESMNLLNDEDMYEESSFSTPALSTNAPPLASTTSTFVNAPPPAYTTPSLANMNKEPRGATSTFVNAPPPASSTPSLADMNKEPRGATSTFVNAPPPASTTPSLADMNKEPSGACELSHTFLQSLSCYADRPSAVGRKLASVIFTRRETETCNCNGSHGRDALPPEKLASLKKYLFEVTQTTASRQAAVWKSVTTCLDASFRSQRAYKKKKELGRPVENAD